jgi:molybdopterin biosynthesis enzyme
VDTGDPLPKDCDAVIMIEDCVEKDDAVALYARPRPGSTCANRRGYRGGDMILPSSP